MRHLFSASNYDINKPVIPGDFTVNIISCLPGDIQEPKELYEKEAVIQNRFAVSFDPTFRNRKEVLLSFPQQCPISYDPHPLTPSYESV